jgi:hypothetical protein
LKEPTPRFRVPAGEQTRTLPIGFDTNRGAQRLQVVNRYQIALKFLAAGILSIKAMFATEASSRPIPSHEWAILHVDKSGQ